MKTALIARRIAIALTAGALLLWLVAESITDTRRNAMAGDHLHRLNILQTGISESVLKLRYGLVSNYDGVNQMLRQARDSRFALESGEAGIVGRGDAAVDRAFQAWVTAFDEYENYLERFKSANAALKNSLQHFAASAEGLRRQVVSNAPGSDVAQRFASLQFDVLRYAAGSDDELRDGIVAGIAELRSKDKQLPAPLARQLNNLLDHADLVVRLRPNVDSLARHVVFPPTATPVEQLTAAFQERVLATERRADRFRYALGILSAMLLVMLAVGLVRLARSTRQTQESHRFLDRVCENIGEAVLATDKKGAIVFANREALRLLGWTREDLLGHGLHETCEAEGAGCGQVPENCPLMLANQRGEALRLDDATFRRRDGSHFPVSLVHVPVAEPGLLGAVTVFRDMTEARAREQDLLLAATVFENSPYGLIVTSRDATIQRVNAAFTNITGFSAEEVIGQNPRLLRSGLHSPAFYENLWQTVLDTGQWKGELRNRRKSGEIYPEWLSIRAVRNVRGEVDHYVGLFSDISEHKEAERRLDYLSNYDPLTGLPNRVLFQDRLDRAIARNRGDGRLHALLFLDLDRFRMTNDTLGHAIGDRLLRAVGTRLRGCLGEADTLSRTSGDQYAVLLEGIRSVSDVAAKAQELLKAFEPPFEFDGQDVFTSTSIGIALYPLDAADAATLLRNADTAMYRAKERGRNNFQFYSADMSADVAEVMRLERGLRKAIEAEELSLHFQPQMDLHNPTRVLGVEALLRWHSTEFGDIGPARFIPIAEKSGLIIAIGDWVLRAACQQARAWQLAGLPQVRMAVNLSALQVHQPGLVQRVRQVLADTGLAPELLELEITESVIMEDVAHATSVLRELREMGCEVAMDDFGTGYSSLSYLKHFPVDALKIDQAFVRHLDTEPGDRAVVNAVLSLGESLGLRIIAEGVETEKQFRCLCDLAGESEVALQGYHFCRPQPAPAIEAYLRQRAVPRKA